MHLLKFIKVICQKKDPNGNEIKDPNTGKVKKGAQYIPPDLKKILNKNKINN
jgi:hypothetical protein